MDYSDLWSANPQLITKITVVVVVSTSSAPGHLAQALRPFSCGAVSPCSASLIVGVVNAFSGWLTHLGPVLALHCWVQALHEEAASCRGGDMPQIGSLDSPIGIWGEWGVVEAICGRLGVVAVPHADLVEAASIRLGCLCTSPCTQVCTLPPPHQRW